MVEAVEDEELTEYSLLTVRQVKLPELKRRLRRKDFLVSGRKEELVLRLAVALEEADNIDHPITPTAPPILPNQVAPGSNII